jgi:uncharacterized protein (TIGR03086 family)
LDGFSGALATVREHQWHDPTPCADWDVHALVNHLVNENLWVPELLAGKTVVEVGDAYDGDLLGDDPAKAFDSSAAAAKAATADDAVLTRTVHLSFGDAPGAEYLGQMFADTLIHTWDLARAVGADERLDPELVQVCAAWFADHEEAYRSAGAIAPRPPVAADADAQTRLLAAWGRGGS